MSCAKASPDFPPAPADLFFAADGTWTAPCTIGAPCSVARLSSISGQLAPGHTVNLKRGDILPAFTLRGSGSFAKATFDSTWASTYATAYAACQASPTYAAIVGATLTAQGSNTYASDGPVLADEGYCRQVAKESAQDAAFAAADAATTWITVRPYGSGANPIVDGGGTSKDAIRLFAPNGGIRIQDLEVRNATRAGIAVHHGTETLGTSPDPEGDDYVTAPVHGLLFERLNIHGVHLEAPPPYPLAVLDAEGYYRMHVAAGIYSFGASYVRVLDSTLNGNDMPWWIRFGQHWLLDDVTAESSDWAHPYFVAGGWITYRNSQLGSLSGSSIGWRGYPAGNAGLFTCVTRDMTLRSLNVTNQRRVLSEINTGTKSGTPTLTFAAAGNTITRSAGSWLTDSANSGTGFSTSSECYATVTGAANADNNVTLRSIVGVTSTVLTLGGAALVNETTSAPTVTARCRIPDGVAIDQECNGQRTLYVDNTFGGTGSNDLDGAALLFLDTGAPTVPDTSHDVTVVVNNTWSNWGAFGAPAMILHTRNGATHPGRGVLIGNTFTRRVPASGNSDRMGVGSGNGVSTFWQPNTLGAAPAGWHYANTNSPSTP